MEKSNCYIERNNGKYCSGCRACVEVCPKKCITMVEDECGFLYPVIDERKCIKCKKCVRVCPISNNVPVYDVLDQEKAYSYITNVEQDLLNSSSGGAFLDIVKSFVKDSKKYAIFGAAFDENNKVKHIYITDLNDIDVLRKSKYVQSDTNDSYSRLKKFLNDGYKVVFSGTPCQVSGLKMYLNKDYKNLLTIDLICHGVPSQKLLDQAIRIEEKRKNIKILKLNFREKIKDSSGKYFSRNIKFFTNNDSFVETNKDNAYLHGFHAALFYRLSCYYCKFASVKRYSDITIGDCWGLDETKYDIHKGISCIITHTKKGEQIIGGLKGNISDLSIDFIITHNNQFSKPVNLSKKRVKFFKNLNDNNFEKRVFKYTKKPLYRVIGGCVKRMIKKIILK